MFQYFYNEGMRKMTVAFGQIFNNIQIKRLDSNGDTVQSIRVPLAYSPKEKYIRRLEEKANLDEREFGKVLPAMAFEISGIAYDGSRKLTKMQKFKSIKTGADGKVLNYNYMPVPYNLSYRLSIFTATAEAGLQIVEQILPFFQPDYTVTINQVPELNLKRDVPIVLNSVDYEDTYSGDLTSRRTVVYTLSFVAKTYLYGPAQTQKVIKETQADLYTDTTQTEAREERIIVVPNPTSADADDDFGFTTTITYYNDGKNYDISTDEDV